MKPSCKFGLVFGRERGAARWSGSKLQGAIEDGPGRQSQGPRMQEKRVAQHMQIRYWTRLRIGIVLEGHTLHAPAITSYH